MFGFGCSYDEGVENYMKLKFWLWEAEGNCGKDNG
jgi:hypothetical protein